MDQPLLVLDHVSVHYHNAGNATPAVNNVSFSLGPESRLGIIGESGSGKTTLAHAIMGLLDGKADITGSIQYRGTELVTMPESERHVFRWKKIAIVFQNGLNTLNPVLTVRTQIAECLTQHLKLPAKEAQAQVGARLQEVGLGEHWADSYPNQLSGGMRQRVFIAMALSCEPEILIIDEPTTALDAIAKQEIINLLQKLQVEKRFALIVASHEMGVIRSLTDITNVMYLGSVVESGRTDDVIFDPAHPYSSGLVSSSTQINCFRDLWGIPSENGHGGAAGCPFYPRCHQKLSMCATQSPELTPNKAGRLVACNRGGIATILEGSGISKTYTLKKTKIPACRNVDITIRSGEVVALIGQSGSGKSTLANILCGFLDKDSGNVYYDGEVLCGYDATRRFDGIQIVFQDPFSAINEHFSVFQAVEEPLKLTRIGTKVERKEMVQRALRDVQLPGDERFVARKCFMLSGGQRQRVAIARSLVMQPRLLIADEISSMLDPSTQANILRFLKGLQNAKGFSMLYITHDLSLARKIADRVYIMKDAEIIETGSAFVVFRQPRHTYTKRLLDCAQL
jgi:peptide/nickel transport system ATP-binding protein